MTEQELVEKIFQSGNFVHGVRAGKFWTYDPRESALWRNRLENGIEPTSAFPFTRGKWVCMALLPKLAMPERYLEALHKGPKNDTDPFDFEVGIVLNRKAVLAKFPNKIFAVGSRFCDSIRREKYQNWYEFNSIRSDVFGMPIRRLPGDVYDDEVRIITDNDSMKIALDLTCWEGLVIKGFTLQQLRVYSQGVELIKPLPVFNPYGQLLSEDIF